MYVYHEPLHNLQVIDFAFAERTHKKSTDHRGYRWCSILKFRRLPIAYFHHHVIGIVRARS